jgi:phytoene dehydrogenase-like protein
MQWRDIAVLQCRVTIIGVVHAYCHSQHDNYRLARAAQGTECHQIIVEDWAKMEQPHGTLFLSMPSLLDPSLCPPGTHVIHAFTPDWIDNWKVAMQPRCVAHHRARVTTAAANLCIGKTPSHAKPGLSFVTFVCSEIALLGRPPQERHCAQVPNCIAQGLGAAEYERKKEEVADSIVARLESYFPGIKNAIVFRFAATSNPCQAS